MIGSFLPRLSRSRDRSPKFPAQTQSGVQCRFDRLEKAGLAVPRPRLRWQLRRICQMEFPGEGADGSAFCFPPRLEQMAPSQWDHPRCLFLQTPALDPAGRPFAHALSREPRPNTISKTIT